MNTVHSSHDQVCRNLPQIFLPFPVLVFFKNVCSARTRRTLIDLLVNQFSFWLDTRPIMFWYQIKFFNCLAETVFHNGIAVKLEK